MVENQIFEVIDVEINYCPGWIQTASDINWFDYIWKNLHDVEFAFVCKTQKQVLSGYLGTNNIPIDC